MLWDIVLKNTDVIAGLMDLAKHWPCVQVIPREVTEEFAKLRQQLPGISISNQLLKQLVYVLHSWILSKLPTYMFLPARKQFGHRRVALQTLDA